SVLRLARNVVVDTSWPAALWRLTSAARRRAAARDSGPPMVGSAEVSAGSYGPSVSFTILPPEPRKNIAHDLAPLGWITRYKPRPSAIDRRLEPARSFAHAAAVSFFGKVKTSSRDKRRISNGGRYNQLC